MNLVTNSITMTSREMADLTEKRHDSVKRTIDTLAEKGVIAFPQIVETSFTAANGHAFHQTRFTPEGIAWIAKRYSRKLAA